jgi:glucosamine--fructose-6-phosphate aminotransferase (isomerizing)
MCGIVGIVNRPPTRPTPTSGEILDALDAAVAALPDLAAVTEGLARVDRLLRGLPGVLALSGQVDLVAGVCARLDQVDAVVAQLEVELDDPRHGADELERRSAELVALKDVAWAVRVDRLAAVDRIVAMAGRDATPSELNGFLVLHRAFSAIDRLEVRGRDSAGVHVFVWDHDIAADALAAMLADRGEDPLFLSGSVVDVGGCLSFVYKAAAEIGQLGDNTAALRAAVDADDLLRRALRSPAAQVAVLGHTRWASVGIISEPNTHPVNSDELPVAPGVAPDGPLRDAPYVVAALNGDVDNHADLRVEHELRIAPTITTDAKVIPTVVSRQFATMPSGGTDVVADLTEAFRRTVTTFEGSVAIGAASAAAPSTLLLALHGSGQGLYVGLADDAYIVASEPYGVVEETTDYVRMDGERGGEILVIDGSSGGELGGIRRIGYDGSDRPIAVDDVTTAEVTTRDIDRGPAPHFLLKEITEAPLSFAKTLRGRIHERDGRLVANVGDRALSPAIREALAAGRIRRVRVIGQGTAAVAGQSIAAIADELTGGDLDVGAITATELSGFHLALDMSDTLVVAVSQSGTTTDTNRTVDLVRARGGHVIAIVNRRGSDLTDKADGVLYTSDGRDVEMSVASTKAFYAQVAAGALLACAIAEAVTGVTSDRAHRLLSSLRAMPDALREVLELRPAIAEIARRTAPSRRYWAVVGNGPNKIAAEEVRIKLSELCYKSMACDTTEDKKHIDLSSEPLILVCAAGLSGSTADDVAKEVAIFRAHKASPVVFASDRERRFPSDITITLPEADPTLGFVLSAMAGHLFGYEAALAIDASAVPLRRVREIVEDHVVAGTSGLEILDRLRTELVEPATAFSDTLRDGLYDGQLEASTALRLSSVLNNVFAERPLDSYQFVTGKVATPTGLLDDLVASLTRAIDELTRPIDTIKHQAKTVTVGISRSDEGVIDRPLVQALLDAGAGREVLSFRALRTLAALDPAVERVNGFTRYGIDGDVISIIDRDGISRELSSRVDTSSELQGTKHRVASEREVLVATGRRDGRTVILVPEVKSGETTGITLLHVTFRDRLGVDAMRAVLQGYDRRYDRLVDWVVETEGSFDDGRLAQIDVETLLVAPISETADHWRT